MTSVLVIDDSAAMRGMLRAMLRQDPTIAVVGEAADAAEGRRLIRELDPDVVTLDIEMPGMNGLDFLAKIMTLRPMPVIIVSSLTARGAAASVQALEIGAFDCFQKPQSIAALRDDCALVRLVQAAANSWRRRSPAPRATAVAGGGSGGGRGLGIDVLAIGASTGGVEALTEVLGGFGADCPPTVIVQHMPAKFTPSFAARLNQTCAPHVVEARSGTLLARGHVYLAPGSTQHMEVAGAAAPRIRLFAGDPVGGHRPAVDVLFRSVARLGLRAVGVLLTGMGSDGAAGLLAMREAGARTIGQDQATSVVYGMPQSAWAIGAVERQLPLGRIAAAALEAAA